MIFDFNNGKVTVLPEAMTVPEVRALHLADKNAGKPLFDMWMKYIFFVYRIGGIYEHQFIGVRKKLTCVHQLSKKEDYWKEIEDKPEVKALIDWYVSNCKSKEEQLLEALDDDIERYLDYLKKIPYSRQVKVEEYKGENKELFISYKTEDNSEEKMKAIKNSKELVLYRKELRKLVKETNLKRKKTGKSFRTRQYESV